MKNSALVNWKTTVGAMIAAIASVVAGLGPEWAAPVAQIIAAIGFLITGYSARDYNKTSEQSGASKP